VDYPGGVRADGLPAVLSDPGRLASLAATGQVGTPPEPMFDDKALARTLAETQAMDAAATGYIAAALADRYDGWSSDDTALLALRVP
jgi:hypothetical protein